MLTGMASGRFRPRPDEGCKPVTGQTAGTVPAWRVLLADDHALVRDAIKQMLERLDPSLSVETVSDLFEAEARLKADRDFTLLLLDYRMPGMEGAASLGRLGRDFPGLRIGIITGYVPKDSANGLIEAGAVGVFPKTMSGPSLLMAMKLAVSGQVYVPWAKDLAGIETEPQPSGLPVDAAAGPSQPLTERERQVLDFVIDGDSNKEIGRALGLQEVTIKIHVSSLCRKFGVNNRTQLATKALLAGLRTAPQKA